MIDRLIEYGPTIVGGASLIVASISLMLWQSLSAPDRPNYPTSGPIKRVFMFGLMVVVAGRSAEIFYGLSRPEPVLITGTMVAQSMFLAALVTTFLVDHLQHWLPPRTHERIRQLRQIANCRPSRGLKAARSSAMRNSTGKKPAPADVVGPALLELRLEGMEVAGPMAGPEVFADK